MAYGLLLKHLFTKILEISVSLDKQNNAEEAKNTTTIFTIMADGTTDKKRKEVQELVFW